MVRLVARLALCVVGALGGVVCLVAVAQSAAGVAALSGRPVASSISPPIAQPGEPSTTQPLSDSLPAIQAIWPLPDATDVPLDASPIVTFTEPVSLTGEALEVRCDHSGLRAATATGGPATYHFALTPPLSPGAVCSAKVLAARVTDLDDPPQHPGYDYFWEFTAESSPVIINELDAIAVEGGPEFLELFDGGRGRADLAGLTVALYSGQIDGVYFAFALDGLRTDERGYLVIGTPATPGADFLLANGVLLDGPAAVALYDAPLERFPFGAPVTTDGLLDAVVYGPGSEALAELLLPGQAALDEGARDQATADSVGRCPNGAGERRATAAYRPGQPTPDQPNECRVDAAPTITGFWPPDGAEHVAPDAVLEVTFSEPVIVNAPLTVYCASGGPYAYTVSGGQTTYRFTLHTPLPRGEFCSVTIDADAIHDVDEDDPPDSPRITPAWSFWTAPPVAGGVVINEVDADTEGVDTAEFIELYDGGAGETDLDGLLVVLLNGGDDLSYRTVDLNGYSTDEDGYFLVGNAAVGGDLTLPNGLLQNGPDAVVLAEGRADDVPNGTSAAAIAGVIDAVVYGPADEPDEGLLLLLHDGQPQIDEDGRDDGEVHSNQRCPNGAGGGRNTAGFRQNTPTPRAASDCVTDTAPTITNRVPPPDATGVSLLAAVQVTFSEPVNARQGWATIECTASGAHDYVKSGGPTMFSLTPGTPFLPEETCTVSLKARLISDMDSDDPPDKPAGNVSWHFSTAAPAADFVLINELDPDTPSTDDREFVELYDGGAGRTDLSGLTLVFYNGYTKASYAAIDLDGQETNGSGYWLAGNAAVQPALVFSNGTLQNGPDAVALYAADATDFPDDTPPATRGLIDAVVYGDLDDAPPELLGLLLAGQDAADEAGRGAADTHALQRCPNGAGGQRKTAAFLANTPSPAATNNCNTDEPPAVGAVTPAGDSTGVSIYTTLSVTFSEPVAADAGWLSLDCDHSSQHTLVVLGGPTSFQATLLQPLSANERCTGRVVAALIHDADAADPPDRPTADHTWSFTTAAPVAENILINELDADTPGSDAAEFIELYDGGVGGTSLSGLVLVLFNGNDDGVYKVVELDNVSTDARGYATIGNVAVPGVTVVIAAGSIQNGADAVALYEGNAADFPLGATPAVTGLRDAIVYGTGDAADAGLLALLQPGEVLVDEAARSAESDSNQRCPNGSGGPRRTATYRQNSPTPGQTNNCQFDEAPVVVAVTPPDGAEAVPAGTPLTVQFSEPVALAAGWLEIECTVSGGHEANTTGGPTLYTITPQTPFLPGDRCDVTLAGAFIHDADTIDPPDTLSAGVGWEFEIALIVAENILINELDADTPGNDAAEFIELFDGGVGGTSLSGLALVLFNGSDDGVYKVIDLDSVSTDTRGYAVVGNTAVPGVTVDIAAGTIQNGADAVALYEGNAEDFPLGATPVITGLMDAIVYGTGDAADAGLLSLLLAGESQVDEAARAAESDSNQRCPNGAGGPRRTAAYRQNSPTPGQTNNCQFDEAPMVVAVVPPDQSEGVPAGTPLVVQFSEPVALATSWLEIECSLSDGHEFDTTGGPTIYTLVPQISFLPGDVCAMTLDSAAIHDADAADPPDTLANDFDWQFEVALVVAQGILINEVDADTPGKDAAEFIELTDGGAGDTSLAGLVLVFFNGRDDLAYYAVDLDALVTNNQGMAVIGGAAVAGSGLTLPAGVIQNGPDAVALYEGNATDFPAGTVLTTQGLRDAVVYATGDAADDGLLGLLLPGETQLDEAGRGAADRDSNQRCPDGAGGARRTGNYRQAQPTPAATNLCLEDDPPAVSAVSPPDGAQGVAVEDPLTVQFSEPVTTGTDWFAIHCSTSGDHDAHSGGGPVSYSLTPATPFLPGDACRVTLHAAAIYDADADDPPDTPTADFTWQFHVAPAPAAGVLINEIDADTPGRDRAEFIELYDGGAGHTDLSGLALVLWNGKGDSAYRVIELDGQTTDAAGYFVAGNAAITATHLTLPDSALQNGPDAIGLYAMTGDLPAAGDPLTLVGLRDAVVYGPPDKLDPGLLALLEPGQPQLDEAGQGAAGSQALARCPNGGGGPRRTAAFQPAAPTPGRANPCPGDAAPELLAMWPPPDAHDVPLTATLHLTFSEPIDGDGGWFNLACDGDQEQPVEMTLDGAIATITPQAPLPAGDECLATVHAERIHDSDDDDPPDTLPATLTWRFHTHPAAPVVVAGFNSNSPVYAGEPMRFTNLSTGAEPLTFRWDFGDETESEEINPVHLYAAPGRYVVHLWATGPTSSEAIEEVVVLPRLIYLPLVTDPPAGANSLGMNRGRH